MKNKISNFLFYNKAILIISFCILAIASYFIFQDRHSVSPDYSVALISPEYYSDEQIRSLENIISDRVSDLNSDGAVSVKVNFYRLALCEDNQDYIALSSLDADLCGNVSTLFFCDSPEKFEAATNGICLEKDFIPVGNLEHISFPGFDNLFVSVRKDNPKANFFTELIEK